jgi:hypothetical protein
MPASWPTAIEDFNTIFIRRPRRSNSLTPPGSQTVWSRPADRMANLSSLMERLTDQEPDVLAGCGRVLHRLVEIAATGDETGN